MKQVLVEWPADLLEAAFFVFKDEPNADNWNKLQTAMLRHQQVNQLLTPTLETILVAFGDLDVLIPNQLGYKSWEEMLNGPRS